MACIFLSLIFLSFLDAGAAPLVVYCRDLFPHVVGNSSEFLLIEAADIGVNVNGHRPLGS